MDAVPRRAQKLVKKLMLKNCIKVEYKKKDGQSFIETTSIDLHNIVQSHSQIDLHWAKHYLDWAKTYEKSKQIICYSKPFKPVIIYRKAEKRVVLFSAPVVSLIVYSANEQQTRMTLLYFLWVQAFFKSRVKNKAIENIYCEYASLLQKKIEQERNQGRGGADEKKKAIGSRRRAPSTMKMKKAIVFLKIWKIFSKKLVLLRENMYAAFTKGL